VVHEAANGPEGLKLLRSQPVDLLFLDINMPEMDGFDVLERIDPATRPVVVFTTAYDDYAIKAFDANAIDYLLKPISQERLTEAVNRAERLVATPPNREVTNEKLHKLLDWLDASDATVASGSAAAEEYLQQISIPYRDRILIVPIDRLVSIEISEGITRLFILEDVEPGTKPGLRKHIVNYTLEQLESRLDPAQFMRVHRSTIVRLAHIQEMVSWFSGRYKLVLSGGHEVIASRERSKVLKERLVF